MSELELFEAFLLGAIASLIGLTCGPGEDHSILSTLMNGWDSMFGYEHPLLRFFTTKEARILRLVCHEFKHNVEVTSWNDPSPIGRWRTTPVGRHLQLWRECFPMAIGAVISSGKYCIEHEKGFGFLRGLQTLKISDAVIPDEVFPYLGGIRELTMHSCTGFTDAAFQHLRGIEYLDITGCTITDAAFPSLCGVKYLNISSCNGITDAAFPYLEGIQELIMNNYTLSTLTDAALAPLYGIEKLVLGFGYRLITPAGCEQLQGIKHLEVPRHMHPLIHLLMNPTHVEDTVLRTLEITDPIWIYALDSYGCSTLHWAAKRGLTRVVQSLLEHGVDPAIQNVEGGTALHWAVQRGHASIVNLLLDRGAALSVENNHGDTPLHWAIKYQQVGIADLLVDRGANLNVQNRRSKTPFACANKEYMVRPTVELAVFIAKIRRLGAKH